MHSFSACSTLVSYCAEGSKPFYRENRGLQLLLLLLLLLLL